MSMKLRQQLLRRIGKVILSVVLLALAGTVLCICAGQFWSAQQSRAAVEVEYTTVAVPTDRYKIQELTDEDGNILSRVITSDQPDDVQDYLDSLTEIAPDIVKETVQNCLVSAYCETLAPINYDTLYVTNNNTDELSGAGLPSAAPYDTAVLEIELTEEPEITAYDMTSYTLNEETGEYEAEDVTLFSVMLTGNVAEVYSLFDGYDAPTGRTITVYVNDVASESELEAMNLEVGGHYIINGSGYNDCDWALRCSLASLLEASVASVDPSSFDWAQDLTYLSGQEALLGVALFQPEGNGTGIYLTQDDLNQMEACEINVQGADSVQRVENNGAEWIETDQVWNKALATSVINSHAFPVIGTESVESMALFAAQSAYITEGRSFTEDEYASGSPVCLVSETLAASNGLSVGDTVTLNLYEWASYQGDYQSTNPSADYYTAGQEFAQTTEFTVVGLYRQTAEWSTTNGSFTPNTILVPEKSIECQTESFSDGAFYTILLVNGTQDQLESLTVDAGYEGLFTYYDQGYTNIVESLESYSQTSQTVLFTGVGLWLVVLVIFLLLFPLQLERDARRMWILGTPDRQIFRFLFLQCGMVTLLGSVAALIGGIASSGRAMELLTQGADEMINLELTPAQLSILCLMAWFAELVVLAVFCWFMTRHCHREASR